MRNKRSVKIVILKLISNLVGKTKKKIVEDRPFCESFFYNACFWVKKLGFNFALN